MAKVLAPNQQFTGASASVNFVNGVGETDNAHLLDWFRSHGYTVEDAKQPKGSQTPKDAKDAKAPKGGKTDAAPTDEAGDADDAGKAEAPVGDPQ